jgi:DNA replication protein DnaC
VLACRRVAPRQTHAHRESHVVESRPAFRRGEDEIDSEPSHRISAVGHYVAGSTGSGKTYLACALAHQACRQGLSALYVRAPRLFEELNLCHADGSFRKRLAAIAKINILLIDDFAIAPIGPRERNDLLELLDDRVGARACIITSQIPVSDWHDYIGDPTLGDAILDRIVHRSHRIHLESKESMREREAAKERAKTKPRAEE